jgi:hypothetical protein
MTIPKYLETFRRAAREAETRQESIVPQNPQNREKSEVSEKRGRDRGLNSLNTLISPPGAPQNACAVCKAPGDLWRFGEALVHQECAAFLPKPEPAEPTAAYQAASPECSVTVIELRQAQRYRKTFAALQTTPPALVDVNRWRKCVEDGSKFLARWGSQAEALGWTSADLFGLHQPPEQPHPSYNRLSRYDWNGLCWLLEGRSVTVLSETAAMIENPDTGSTTLFRKNNRPALGPLGDSLLDIDPRRQ